MWLYSTRFLLALVFVGAALAPPDAKDSVCPDRWRDNAGGTHGHPPRFRRSRSYTIIASQPAAGRFQEALETWATKVRSADGVFIAAEYNRAGGKRRCLIA
jgi:hypothetical protein